MRVCFANMTAATKNQFVNVFRVPARRKRGETLTFRATLAAAVVVAAVAVAIAVAYFPILLGNESNRDATHGKAAK